MKLDSFFEKFDQFADAPDAVAKMRELVLRLAFSGSLTGKQPTHDGVPEGWESRTFESLSASISSGFACSRSHQVENGHVHLRTHNISTLGTLNFDLLVRIDPKMVDPQKASIRAGDILFNNTNSQELVGKTSLVDRDYDYGFSNHITRIRLKDGIFPGFVVFYLTLLRNSGHFARLCTRWINQAAINTDTLKKQTIPMPPLAEQKRIVAKVDELMALCDRLEAQQQERGTQHAALARASLARFADAPTPANLLFLFHPSYAIPPADLRKSILTLAVQGKLVPQDPNDEPASALAEQIRGERLRLAKTGRSGKAADFAPIAETAQPYDIPESWAWVPLGNVTFIRTGKLDANASSPDGQYPFFTCARDPLRIDRYAYDGECVLLAGNGNFDVNYYDGKFEAYQRTYIIEGVSRDTVDGRYLFRFIQNYADTLREMSVGGVISYIKIGFLTDAPLPLPPLAEQRRIVAKVEQLMALVDALEQQLAASRATGGKLLSALVAELTGTPSSGSA